MSKNARRRQQVHRQLIMLGALAVLIAAAVIGFYIQHTKKEKALETARVQAQEEKKSEKKKEEDAGDKEETPKESLARVKKEATEKGYPKSVIKLLGKNEETVQFVEDYGEKKDVPPADTVGTEYTKGQIPPLIQWDERWGYAPYGTSIIAVSGCGPVCLSMVISGLTGDWTVTPAKVAAYGTENNYVDADNNTYWRFMEEAPANWKISVKEVPLIEEQVAAELQAGHPIICSVGPGDFTANGHFIVLTGYEGGTVTVNDPFSKKNSSKTWVFSEIQGQIAAMWAYSP